jgi:hypothetical protein
MIPHGEMKQRRDALVEALEVCRSDTGWGATEVAMFAEYLRTGAIPQRPAHVEELAPEIASWTREWPMVKALRESAAAAPGLHRREGESWQDAWDRQELAAQGNPSAEEIKMMDQHVADDEARRAAGEGDPIDFRGVPADAQGYEEDLK